MILGFWAWVGFFGFGWVFWVWVGYWIWVGFLGFGWILVLARGLEETDRLVFSGLKFLEQLVDGIFCG